VGEEDLNRLKKNINDINRPKTKALTRKKHSRKQKCKSVNGSGQGKALTHGGFNLNVTCNNALMLLKVTLPSFDQIQDPMMQSYEEMRTDK